MVQEFTGIMSVVLPDAMRTTTFPTLRGGGDARRQHHPKRDEHIIGTPKEWPSAPTYSCNEHLQPPNDRAQPLPTEMVTTSTRAMGTGRTCHPEGDSASERTTPRDKSSAGETAKINWAAQPLPDYSAGRNNERSDRTRARRAMTRATTGTRRAAKDTLTLRDQLNELAGRGEGRTAHAAARLLQWAARTHRRNVGRPRHRNRGEAGAPADPTPPQEPDMPRQLEPPQETTETHASELEEPQLLPRAGPKEWNRWEQARASGGAYKNQVGAGNASGSKRALAQSRSLTLVCLRRGCQALVDYKTARRQAMQAGRVQFEEGDGCAGPKCSADYRPVRFAKRQREHAGHLIDGTRQLAKWPRDRADRDVYVFTERAAAATYEDRSRTRLWSSSLHAYDRGV